MRIQWETSHEIEINKSRFICYLQRCETEEDARNFIKDVKRMHPKATHHCSAILIDKDVQRSNDDGEPSGTAGIPMLEVLRKNNMEKICAVTVRYFGGILLGAGGLVRAYSSSVSEALNRTQLFEVKNMNVYILKLDYSTASRMDKVLGNVSVMNKEYEEMVSITFASEDETAVQKIDDYLAGKYKSKFLYQKEVEIQE